MSAKYGTSSSFGEAWASAAEWDRIAEYGFDAVWLMGVWERSPAGIAIASHNQALVEDFRQALPDYHPLDNVGSPYCVRSYTVDQLLGGRAGLAIARKELAARDMRLILDFVPNHVAPDHAWVNDHPEYFIQGGEENTREDPSAYLRVAGRVMACGRDPFFAPWPDVLQLNGFHPGLRQAVRDTLASIADQCDGVRCDMAMLLENPIFERTWGRRAGERPDKEYWAEIIPAMIKQSCPNFLFIAEAYWDREWELQQQGFDFCYDKRLYDRLEHESPESVRQHLCAELSYQDKLVRFIENHDEPRAGAAFSPEKALACAVVVATLPGARLFRRRTVRAGRKLAWLPVFLGRRPEERPDNELQAFYRKLLKTVRSPVFQDGHWRLCERTGWPDNASFQNLIAWSWVKNEERRLVVVNLSGRGGAGARPCALGRRTWGDAWVLSDALTGKSYDRKSDEVQSLGLYVELAPLEMSPVRVSPPQGEAARKGCS